MALPGREGQKTNDRPGKKGNLRLENPQGKRGHTHGGGVTKGRGKSQNSTNRPREGQEKKNSITAIILRVGGARLPHIVIVKKGTEAG